MDGASGRALEGQADGIFVFGEGFDARRYGFERITTDTWNFYRYLI